MYQTKSSRKLFYVDMFPMFNLVLIILMFLLLYGRSAVQCPIRINLPVGHYFNTADPDADVMGILVGEGKIMLRLESAEVREDALKQMGDKYHVSFSNAETTKFGKTDVIGTSITKLKKYIAGYYNFHDYYAQAGLPLDTASNELFDWIRCSRIATFNKHNTPLRIAIQADGETPYPILKHIISLLQKQRVNKFTIVYSFLWQK